MIIRLWITPTAKQDAQGSCLQHHMPEGYISTQNINFQTYENPFAGGEWFNPWLPGGLYQDFAQRTFKKLYRRESGV